MVICARVRVCVIYRPICSRGTVQTIAHSALHAAYGVWTGVSRANVHFIHQSFAEFGLVEVHVVVDLIGRQIPQQVLGYTHEEQFG